jgi:hypothetical protein
VDVTPWVATRPRAKVPACACGQAFSEVWWETPYFTNPSRCFGGGMRGESKDLFCGTNLLSGGQWS